jgi:hypothetical protein
MLIAKGRSSFPYQPPLGPTYWNSPRIQLGRSGRVQESVRLSLCLTVDECCQPPRVHRVKERGNSDLAHATILETLSVQSLLDLALRACYCITERMSGFRKQSGRPRLDKPLCCYHGCSMSYDCSSPRVVSARFTITALILLTFVLI